MADGANLHSQHSQKKRLSLKRSDLSASSAGLVSSHVGVSFPCSLALLMDSYRDGLSSASTERSPETTVKEMAEPKWSQNLHKHWRTTSIY